jgi:hypothetical protein
MLNLCKKWKDKSISSTEAADYNDIVNSKMGKVTAFWEQLGETRTAFMKKHMPGVRE